MDKSPLASTFGTNPTKPLKPAHKMEEFQDETIGAILSKCARIDLIATYEYSYLSNDFKHAGRNVSGNAKRVRNVYGSLGLVDLGKDG